MPGEGHSTPRNSRFKGSIVGTAHTVSGSRGWSAVKVRSHRWTWKAVSQGHGDLTSVPWWPWGRPWVVLRTGKVDDFGKSLPWLRGDSTGEAGWML